MLQPFLYILNAQRNILASGSPRRKEILENVGLKFEVIPSTFEENLDKSQFTPQEYVVETAKLKTSEVAERLSQTGPLPDLIIGCDTVVYQNNQIIEKPRDKADAVRILTKLSGRSHSVFSGLTLFVPASSDVLKDGCPVVDSKFRCASFVEQTEVFMCEMSSEVIDAYIATGEPMDKAGGYGIQALGGTLVNKIHGDNFNVMGFPLPRFAREMSRIYSKK
ncbi:probable bifunctional dTTP/UTP pyrophosphatase/methyltransferase protein isoform X2 [Biomphalaria glabrata]|nr:probable bifunctional dTTP/UTP pyrophosphatase/methyltransferase protein isoform X2 [Biomphalaria glabrata]XP_055893949.1 probable bifunctional dTTP/UTP pyrophosphatase/methyltransferase protein isoform X2 [Biomphalaria glabrata]XP_055893951.1 probable bifunctional dTTP/UTP pyrophosphatase/methyltransferase protein isoform X2 [Biomphalaria glabrata]XP_055893952.1 probable bifunctional dTTP/UTP pyrophosphatase/methyltransferase protein isoform X2 [Biomphalaria glabrata]